MAPVVRSGYPKVKEALKCLTHSRVSLIWHSGVGPQNKADAIVPMGDPL